MASLEMPSIGAIIPTEKGRKVAYAVFAICSLLVGNAVIYFSTVYTEVPLWIIGISAVLNNTAPIFSSIAMANIGSGQKVDIPDAVIAESVAEELNASHGPSTVPDPE